MLFKNRRKKILSFLRKNGFDALLVQGTFDVFYLTGFYGSYGFLLLSKDKNFLLVDGRYLEEAQKSQDKDLEVVLIKDLFQDLKELTKNLRIKSLSFEPESMTYSMYSKMIGALDFLKILPLKDSIIKKQRSVKDEEEISILKEAVNISKKTFTQFKRNHLKSGKLEKEISADLNYLLEINGEGMSFETIVLSGEKTSLPHGKPSNKIVNKDDAILIDYGLLWKNYCTDHTRVIFLGDSKLKKYYKIVKDAFKYALKFVKPGIEIGKIDKAVREYLAKYDLEKNFVHSSGHGIGLEVHEYPVVNFKNKDKLKQGMVITLEPGLYFPGFGGVRYEEMILVTEKGFDVL
ncbi:MAG: Xaa-Pro peptidase family protein [Proteobacteria bacterium]|nr:Xaa-Pro peptidase family protein [Pseudomonadota bacterium]